MVIIDNLIKSGHIKLIEGLYLRQNKYENSIILTDSEFTGKLIKSDVLDKMINLDIKEIELNDSLGFSLNDLNFVDQIKWVEGIKIIACEGVNSNNLKNLINIKKFTNNYSDEAIDFLSFKKLEKADILWSKGRENIAEVEDLKSLTIHKLNLKNLNHFKKLKNLKDLSLIGSSIESLEGIENFPNLETLELHLNNKLNDLSLLSHCKKLKEIRLTSLSKVESLTALENCSMLEILIVDNCKKIVNKNTVFELKNLKVFSYLNSGEFSSIKEIDSLAHLERFAISDTNIKDGNLDPLLKLKKLIFCFFKDKKHYSLKLQEVKIRLGIT